MTASGHTEKTIFLEAAEIDSPSERAAYLERSCGDDQRLRDAVEALLESHQRSQGLLDAAAPPIVKCAGTTIGPYKLLRQIGEGGMGTVFMAEQFQPVERQVALKLIKAGMDSGQVIARFETERQALALMDHPNIARVLDAGTTAAGRPYFAMELVEGVPITTYCDENRLTPRARLELFVPVCQAIQHAHQKGIIHRDVKPSNVLVTQVDGKPVPKVIDFGVAKATEQRLNERTLFTQYGTLVGTLEYMSPEQAELSALGVDTRSDVYSLGVLLYELLTGSTPLPQQRLREVAYGEILRMIKEDEPPRPSTRLSNSGEVLESISVRRHMEPAKLTKLVRGELDWIVMKTLEKDRNCRYDTAAALAADVQRYLRDEPVLACPPSTKYRFAKFARRNRMALSTAALVLTALVLGTVVSATQAVRATRAEQLAEANFRQARSAVDDMYTQVAEKWLSHQPRLQPVQREFLEKALLFYTQFAEKSGADAATRQEAATAIRRVGEIRHKLGDSREAEQAYQEAINRLQSLADAFPDEPIHRQSLADALHRAGVLFGDVGRYLEEEKSHRRALALQEKLTADFPASIEYRRDLGLGYWYMGRVLNSLRRWSDAETSFRLALVIQKSLVREFPSDLDYRAQLAESHLGLGVAVRHFGRSGEYQQSLHKAGAILKELVAEAPTSPEYHNALANVQFWLAAVLPPHDAEQSLRTALAMQEKLAADFPLVADYRYDLFRSLRELGNRLKFANRLDDAEKSYRDAVAVGEKLAAQAPLMHYYRGGLAAVCKELADLLQQTGRFSEAETVYRQAIHLYIKLIAEFPDAPRYPRLLVGNYFNLAQLLIASGRPDEAHDMGRKALQERPNDDEVLTAVAWNCATSPEQALRDPARAVELARKAVELAPKRRGHWTTLGAACYRAGDWKAAVTALEKSMQMHQGGDSVDWFLLAMTSRQQGQAAEARKWYDQAVEWMEKNKPQDEDMQRFREEAAELLQIGQSPTTQPK